MHPKSAIVYVTYDGAVNSASGVGVVSRYFVDSMPEVASLIEDKFTSSLDFHVIAINLSEAADGYDEKIAQKTADVCNSLRGELHLIDNGLNGEKGYGSIDNWRIACENASEVINQISNDYEHITVYLVDTPFMCLPYYFKSNKSHGKTFIIVPHSDTYSHFPDAIDDTRLAWERKSMRAVTNFENIYLAKTSGFLLRTLQTHHTIPTEKIVPLQTGLVPSSNRFTSADEVEIAKALNSRGIPLNRQLIFSVGRGVSYKGYTDLIESFSLLLPKYPDLHLVFIAPPHKNEVGITPELKDLINEKGITTHCTAIFELDMELPRLICQWKRTRIVAQLSHREPFGLVPEEVRLWAKERGPVVVASHLDGFIEQLTNGEDGFLVQPDDHSSVAATFANILDLPETELDRIRYNGLKRVLKDYDYTKEILKSYESVISKEISNL